jgi:hypothetical protein
MDIWIERRTMDTQTDSGNIYRGDTVTEEELGKNGMRMCEVRKRFTVHSLE